MRDQIIFNNNLGQKLVGVLHKPVGQKSYPAVIICHGFTEDKDKNYIVNLAENLKENGIAVFRFDFTSAGESEGDFFCLSISQEIADLESAVNFLSQKEGIDQNKIGLVGHSLGGVVVSIYAAQNFLDSRIKALVTTSMPIDFKKTRSFYWGKLQGWERRGHAWVYHRPKKKLIKLGYQFCEGALKIEADKILTNINKPYLFICGAKDKSVPFDHRDKVSKWLKEPQKVVVISGAGHRLNKEEHLKVVRDETVGWFKRYLIG